MDAAVKAKAEAELSAKYQAAVKKEMRPSLKIGLTQRQVTMKRLDLNQQSLTRKRN